MAALNDRVFDNGLTVLDTEANILHYLSADPGLVYANLATYTRGNKTSPTVSAPSDRTGGGRKVTVSAVTDGVGTSTGQVSFYALADTVNSRILAVGAISPAADVANGGVITSPAFDIGIPDPA